MDKRSWMVVMVLAGWAGGVCAQASEASEKRGLGAVSSVSVGAASIGGDRVLGSELLVGGYGGDKHNGYSGGYVLSKGDRLKIKMWGRRVWSGDAEVDVNGKIWIEGVGSVAVGGERVDAVQKLVEGAVKAVYVRGVDVYVSPEVGVGGDVGVEVGGGVVRPGRYVGGVGDGILRYLTLAGGIGSGGSYREVIWWRGNREMGRFDLYDFLRAGGRGEVSRLMEDGDRLWVGSSMKAVWVRAGGVRTRVEYRDIGELRGMLEGGLWGRVGGMMGDKPVTMVVWSGVGGVREVGVGGGKWGVLDRVKGGGDEVEVLYDEKVAGVGGEVVVEVGGGDVVSRVKVVGGRLLSDVMRDVVGAGVESGGVYMGADGVEWGIPLVYRSRVAREQKEALVGYGRQLMRMALVGGSKVREESELREREAKLVGEYVGKLEGMEMKGQVVLEGGRWGSLRVEEGDRVVIERVSQTVMVVGDVLSGGTFLWEEGMKVGDVVRDAGVLGGGNRLRYLVVSRGGKAKEVDEGAIGGMVVKRGDVVYVMRAVSDEKGYEVARGVLDLVFKAAVAAGTLVRIL